MNRPTLASNLLILPVSCPTLQHQVQTIHGLDSGMGEPLGAAASAPSLHLPVGKPGPEGGPSPPRTVYDDDPRLYLGPSGSEETLVNAQGLKLRSYFWPSPSPSCVLVFCHGHHAHMLFELVKSRVSQSTTWLLCAAKLLALEHTHRSATARCPSAPQGLGQAPEYEGSWVQAMNAAGVSVCGVDNQGCGRSEGLHGVRFYVDSFDDYVTDVLQLAGEVSAGRHGPGFSGLPLFIGGISLGGCIAFNAALKRRELFRGLALLAPMLSLEHVSRKGLNLYLRPIAALLSWLMPTAAIIATDRNTMHPEIQASWDADPLVSHGKSRVRNATEYIRATERTMARLEEAELPLLIFHSENDTMCDVEGSKQLYLRAKVRWAQDGWLVAGWMDGRRALLATAFTMDALRKLSAGWVTLVCCSPPTRRCDW